MGKYIDQAAVETAQMVGKIDADELAISASAPPGLTLPMQDTPELRAALKETPAYLLIGVYSQIVGPNPFLERLKPHVKPAMMGGPQVPDDLTDELREALLVALTSPEAAKTEPVRKGQLNDIMDVVAGEPVGDEFIPLLIEQMGFTPLGRFLPKSHNRPPAGFRVAVIGAGMTGLAFAIKLSQAGYDYQVFEKQEEVGGVWWSNRYPGVAVDTPSHFYSYSFQLNPDWPRYYSNGEVLRNYWSSTADKFGVRPHISFNTEVISTVWSEENADWTVTYRDASGTVQEQIFDIVICASGLFSQSQNPNVPGLDRFQGKAVHTAHWDQSLDVAGKQVVQIGNGASGVQVGPEIAQTAAKLTVFQRTPVWVRARAARGQDTSDGLRWGLRHIPHLAQWMRFFTYWNASDGVHPLVKRDPEWTGDPLAVNRLGSQLGKAIIEGMKAKLEGRPDLIEKVLPNYPLFGKRLLQDSDWLDTLKRDNVELVAQAVKEIVDDGVVAKDGTHYPADIIVLATGFAVTKMLHHIKFVGRNGVQLSDLWGEDNPRAYYGTFVPHFPNFFIMHGPNIGATHGAGANIYSEAQIDYVLSCLDMMFERDARTVEVSEEAFEDFNALVDAACGEAVWSDPRVSTYYLNSKRRNFISWPWRIVDFWERMKRPSAQDLRFDNGSEAGDVGSPLSAVQ